MSGDSQQWAALDSQNERLVGAAQLQLCGDGQRRGDGARCRQTGR